MPTFDVAAAKALGAALLYAPRATSELPLVNQGSATVPAATMGGGALLQTPGLVNGYTGLALDAVDDFIDTNWLTRTNLAINPWARNNITGWAAWFESNAPERVITGTKYGAAVKQLTKGTKSFVGALVPTAAEITSAKAYSAGVWVKVPQTGFYRIDIRKTDSSSSISAKLGGLITAEMKANEWYFWSFENQTAGATYAPNVVCSRFTNIGGGTPQNFGENETLLWGGIQIEQATTLGAEFFPIDAQTDSGLVGFAGTSHASASDMGPWARGTARTFVWASQFATDKTWNGPFSANGASANAPGVLVAAAKSVSLRLGDGSTSTDYPLENPMPAGTTHLAALTFDHVAQTAQLTVNGTIGPLKTGLTQAMLATGYELAIAVTFAQFQGGMTLPFAVFTRKLSAAEIDQVLPTRIQVTERPPMRQYVIATTPGGATKRWGEDEPRADQVLRDLSDSDTVPGGYKEATGSLPRLPNVEYGDMAPGTDLAIYGAGQRKVGEYRLERAPQSSGDYLVLDPAAVGYQAHLSDDESAQGIPLDADMGAFGEPSARLKVINKVFRYNVNPQVELLPAGDQAGAEVPAISHAWTKINNNAATEPDVALSVYDSNGVELGRVILDFVRVGGITAGDVNWQNELQAWSNDIGSSFTVLKDFNATTTTKSEWAIPAGRFFLVLQDYYAPAFNGEGNWQVQWRNIRIQDRSGIPIIGTWPLVGVLQSDVLAYGLARWAPRIQFTTGPYGTLQPTTFPIPHLTFKEPGPVAAWVTGTNRFELKEWAVWNDRTFWLNDRGARAGRKRWRSRVRPTRLKDTGPALDRTCNGVIVEFTDTDGTTKMVGPPGSGFRKVDERLIDTDPLSPANQIPNERLWKKIRMKGISTLERAAVTGQMFLEKCRELDGSGSAEIDGWLEDENGNPWPYYVVKSGDLINFVDSSLPGDRYIVNVQRSRSERKATITLDGPPDWMEAMLEEMDSELIPLGLASG